MAKKDPRNTRRKIVTTAWKLFYEQGYDSTTVDQIISESGTSKGSFLPLFQRERRSFILPFLTF